MTGPIYPPGPQPGSNVIGEFIIGYSPIGDIPSFSVWQTVISQYANSPIITQLVQNFAQYVDQTINLTNFFDLMWNVDTAQGYGLDVWGRIVGVNRVIEIPSGAFFGFTGPTGVSGDPFNVSSFYDGGNTTGNYALSDSPFRLLILAKALTNISNGSIPSINQILLNLFPGRGNCFCTDGQDMTMTYTFNFVLSSVELAIVQQSGVLPKPVGVSATVVQNP